MTRIDILPDELLLEIFDFYVGMRSWYRGKTGVEEWQSLIHVCRRWRTLVFESPRRLNLLLCCTPDTPLKDALDVWPALPLIVRGSMISSMTNNIIAAFGQSNRVCRVQLWDLTDWQLEQVLAAMQVPFPELTDLRLRRSAGETMPAIPDSFLDGSAPSLRSFTLDGIPFPGLPKLLLSATHLVHIALTDIPHSEYISPEATIALISVLSSLEWFTLGFEFPQSRPDHEARLSPPSNRSVLPSLCHFYFQGVIEYLEDLVACIDAPQLDKLHIRFFNQIDFDTPRLTQFINRTPKSGKREAIVQFNDHFSRVQLSPGILEITILCRELNQQLSSIVRVCNSSLDPLFTVEDLYIEHPYLLLVLEDGAIESTLWLQLLLPFTGVKNLYLSKEFAPGIAAALQELVGSRITEVLPSLQNIFVKGLEPSGPFQEKIGQFVAARQLSECPITISGCDSYWCRSS